jgi:argininosuccinate lyase
MAAMLAHLQVNRAACLAAASDPALLATDLVDHLVSRGMPFRKAHHVVGALVAHAEKLGKPLNQLAPEEARAVDKALDRKALAVLDLKRSLARRNLPGAPGDREVARQIVWWKKRLER